MSPANGGPSIAGNRQVTLGGGNLASSLMETIQVTDIGNVTVSSANAENLQMAVDPTTGQFSGSFTHPALNKAIKFNGVLLQLDGSGSGYFLGNSASGFVVLEPTP